MPQSGCIRPESTGKDRDRESRVMRQESGKLHHCDHDTLVLGWFLTLFRVCVCPMRIRALEEMMERQKLMRITERSERMYLQENDRKQIRKNSVLFTNPLVMYVAQQTYSQGHTQCMIDPGKPCFRVRQSLLLQPHCKLH